MAIREIAVSSLGELIEAVTPAEPDPQTGRWRDTGIYHGSPVASAPLLTTLDRLGGTDRPHSKAHLEGHLLRNFSRYSRPHLQSIPTNEWELLILAQHHGAPTRLLDWSYSPLVAAHFATWDLRSPRARAIWLLDWQWVHERFELPRLALLIQDLVHLFGSAEPFTPWRLIGGRGPAFASMVEPPSLDSRIVAQSAVFTVTTDTSLSFDRFIEAHGLSSTLTKLIIPGEAAPRIRDQLDIARGAPPHRSEQSRRCAAAGDGHRGSRDRLGPPRLPGDPATDRLPA